MQTELYNTFADHPVDQLYKAGVSLCVSTDASTIAGITLTKEYEKLQQPFGWATADFYQGNVYALEAAFIPAKLRYQLLLKLKLGYGGSKSIVT